MLEGVKDIRLCFFQIYKELNLCVYQLLKNLYLQALIINIDMSDTITFEVFSKIDLRVGTIIEVKDFPEARKPAYQLTIDFGDLGVKKTSAQITVLYSMDDLLGKQIVANVNFEKKQIANFMSECLVTGAVDSDKVILLSPEEQVPNGTPIR
jgi:tRNA-binding protein